MFASLKNEDEIIYIHSEQAETFPIMQIYNLALTPPKYPILRRRLEGPKIKFLM